MANIGFWTPQAVIGHLYNTGGPSSTNATTLNAANGRIAYAWMATQNKTINKVKVRASAVTGTLAATDLQCDIYSDSSASTGPNASLGSTTTVTATPTGAAYIEFTGLSVAITAGTRYWVVLRNLNGTPASNFPTITYSGANTSSLAVAGSNVLNNGIGIASSTDGGATYTATISLGIPSFRLEYSDGSFNGLSLSAIAADVTNTVYSAREVGCKFTTPSNIRASIFGVAFPLIRTGSSPTGNLRFRVYQGTTLIGTTVSYPPGNVASGSALWYTLYFATPITIEPNTSYRVVIAEETNADASTNRYQTYFVTVDTDANNLALLPFNGTLQQTYFDGSSWTDTTSKIGAFALLVASNLPFLSKEVLRGGS